MVRAKTWHGKVTKINETMGTSESLSMKVGANLRRTVRRDDQIRDGFEEEYQGWRSGRRDGDAYEHDDLRDEVERVRQLRHRRVTNAQPAARFADGRATLKEGQ